MIGKFRIVMASHEYLADFMSRRFTTVRFKNPQRGVTHCLANTSRMTQPLCAVAVGDNATFSAAVKFVDYRTPPVDHGAFYGGRTHCTCVDNVFEARHIVLKSL